jgi:hypothetical protein
MRQIPELDFRDDRSMEHAQQIAETLRHLDQERQQSAKSASSVDSENGG